MISGVGFKILGRSDLNLGSYMNKNYFYQSIPAVNIELDEKNKDHLELKTLLEERGNPLSEKESKIEPSYLKSLQRRINRVAKKCGMKAHMSERGLVLGSDLYLVERDETLRMVRGPRDARKADGQ